MMRLRPAHERGHADHGWLDTYHTFSFASYRDPQHVGFRSLRVMNEDIIAPDQGFGEHPHHNMEIITYVLSGSLEHKDSMGNGEVLKAGELQRMTAGTGITHSEFNPSGSEPVHLYQIWIRPERKGLEPSYEQKSFPAEDRANALQLVASPDARDGSLLVHQNARIYLAGLSAGAAVTHAVTSDRYVWLQTLRGAVRIQDQILRAGDGAAFSDEDGLTIKGLEDSEVMLFDLA